MGRNLICNETNILLLQNPICVVSAVILDKSKRKAAYSNNEMSLCQAIVDHISEEGLLFPDRRQLESSLGYFIEFVYATEGKTFSYDPENCKRIDIGYVNRRDAFKEMPTISNYLFTKPGGWVTKGNERKESEWAEKVYRKLIAN